MEGKRGSFAGVPDRFLGLCFDLLLRFRKKLEKKFGGLKKVFYLCNPLRNDGRREGREIESTTGMRVPPSTGRAVA